MESHAGTPAWGGNKGGGKKEGWRAEEGSFPSAGCGVEGGRDEFSGRPQFGHIALRHAADVAVLENATTCPFHQFADGLLLGCGNASCCCQDLVAKLIESQTCSRPVTIVVGRRRAGPVGGWLARSVPAMLRVSFLSSRATPTPPAQQNGHPRQVLQLLSGDQRGGTPSFEDGSPSSVTATWPV